MAKQMASLDREISELRQKLLRLENEYEYLRQSLAGEQPDRKLEHPPVEAAVTMEQLVVGLLIGTRVGYFPSDLAHKVAQKYPRPLNPSSLREITSRMKRKGLIERRSDGKWYGTTAAHPTGPVRYRHPN